MAAWAGYPLAIALLFIAILGTKGLIRDAGRMTRSYNLFGLSLLGCVAIAAALTALIVGMIVSIEWSVDRASIDLAMLWPMGGVFALIVLLCAFICLRDLRRLHHAKVAVIAAAEALDAGKAIECPPTGVTEADRILEAMKSVSYRLTAQSSELTCKTVLLDATLQSMDQGLIMTGPDMRVTLFNKRSVDLLGLSEEFLNSRPRAEDIATAQWESGEFDNLPNAVAEKMFSRFGAMNVDVYEWTRPNGIVIEARSSATSDGGFLWTYTDVSARKRAEEALTPAIRAANDARREADLANAAKTRFIATISHEIRTPLNAVVGYADVLLDRDDLDTDARRQVNAIHTAGAALSSIVGDVLAFARIDAGKLDLSIQSFDLSALLDQCLTIMTPSANAAGLSITMTIDNDVGGWVEGDLGHIRQILINLMSNGIKFTTVGGVSLSVKRIDHSDMVRFEVADTGFGIPDDQRHLLFAPFERLDGEHAKLASGAGLGLAISKRLVEEMGGDIGFINVEGGAVFWFILPLPHGEPILQSAGKGKVAEPKNQSVLVVDDVATNLEIAKNVLQFAGYAVDTANDGETALALITKRSYRVILMDIRMPGLDGLAVTGHIRAMAEPACHVPVIAVSANVFSEQILNFRASGMDGHLAKPFRKSAMIEAVEQAVSAGFNRAVFDEMTADAPPGLTARLLDGLNEALAAVLARESKVELADRAHDLVSRAGLLGFRKVSALAADLETVCRKGEDPTVAAASLAAVISVARETSAALRLLKLDRTRMSPPATVA